MKLTGAKQQIGEQTHEEAPFFDTINGFLNM